MHSGCIPNAESDGVNILYEAIQTSIISHSEDYINLNKSFLYINNTVQSILTANSMAYRIRRFNAAFTRAL